VFSNFSLCFALMIDPSVKLSFDALLKLQEVIQRSKTITALADIRTDIPSDEEQAGVYYGTVGQAVLRRGQW
jgi:hypothetical protein